MRYPLILLLFLSIPQANAQSPIILSKAQLLDKIKGGWAGQTIGVTFGGPVEFRYNGTIIQEYHPIPWYKGYVADQLINNGGLYDDLYMDLTFVDVMEREGLDAPANAHAQAYANAGYMLWHANQAGRYNILNGMSPPACGHWLNNPHADCIDYQIEADFAGLMSPGMPNTASEISDRIGHIMNSGDGWYGGVFVAAMYTQAFLYDDPKKVVSEALKTIPAESKFYKCIADVIKWQEQYPDDWQRTWLEVQTKWSTDVGCPDGVFAPFNIDATVNSAYVVIGILYGQGDYTQTIEITTRCGQDADCNPSTAAGVLGAITGYDKIPAFWKTGLEGAEDIPFPYTTISLNKAYALGLKHALENIRLNGGKVEGEQVTIAVQSPKAVPLEQNFEGLFPQEKKYSVNHDLSQNPEYSFSFTGTGFVVKGESAPWKSTSDYVFEAELYIDGKLAEAAPLPANFTTRRYDFFWNYQLNKGPHEVIIKVKNPNPDLPCRITELLFYSDTPPSAGGNVYRFGQLKKQ